MPLTFEKTERGFSIYGRLKDSKGTVVRLQESSAAFEACAWVFCEDNENFGNPSPHLTKANAADLIKILQAFIDDPTIDDRTCCTPEKIAREVEDHGDSRS